MKAQKIVVDCVHKITRFQAHKYCNGLASICQKQCQNTHGDVLVMSLEVVEDHFKGIKELLQKEVKIYVGKLKVIYEQMLHQLQTQYVKNTEEMADQLMDNLIKNVELEKSVISKIENKRYERIRCNQLMNFMEESNIQQKIKKSAHIHIYQKYFNNLSKFKDIFFKYSSQIIQSKTSHQPPKTNNQQPLPQIKNITPPKNVPSPQTTPLSNKATPPQPHLYKPPNLYIPPNANIRDHDRAKKAQLINHTQHTSLDHARLKMLEQKNRKLSLDNRSLNAQLNKNKYQLNLLKTQKKNLQRELANIPPKRASSLAVKTWNILYVSTKKIKRDESQVCIEERQPARESEPQPAQDNQVSQEIQEEPSQHQNQEKSQSSESNQEPQNEPKARDISRQNSQNEQPEKIPPIQMQQTRAITGNTTHRPLLLNDEPNSVVEEDKIVAEQLHQQEEAQEVPSVSQSGGFQFDKFQFKKPSQEVQTDKLRPQPQIIEINSNMMTPVHQSQPSDQRPQQPVFKFSKKPEADCPAIVNVSASTKITPSKVDPQKKDSLFGIFSRLMNKK